MNALHSEDALGAQLTTARRSARGWVIGGAILVAVFGGLSFFNLAGRGGRRGLVGAAIAALVAIPAVLAYARSPKRITAREGGLVVSPYLGRPRSIAWSEIVEGRIWIAPLGKQPHVLSVRIADGRTLSASEVEYHDVGALIDAVLAHASDRVRDERGGQTTRRR